jgi:AraC-like DNA-binding protein
MLVVQPAPHDQVHNVVSLISRELSHPTPGQQTVLDRLLDVLLVMAMRASFEQSSTAPRWYHAASDPRLGRALQAMHNEPQRAWTVPELAHLSAMSRPSFARNFERALGQLPHRLAANARSRLSTGGRTHLGTDRRSHRLQLTQRFRGDIPPTLWISTRPVAATTLVEAVDSSLGAFQARDVLRMLSV